MGEQEDLFMMSWVFCWILTASVIQRVVRSDSWPIIVASSESVMWFSVLTWSVIAVCSALTVIVSRCFWCISYLYVVPLPSGVHTDSKPRSASLLLVAWLSGRTSVFGRSTFPVLRSTCSWRVTTYVGKPSAIGQPTRPTQPFIRSGPIDE